MAPVIAVDKKHSPQVAKHPKHICARHKFASRRAVPDNLSHAGINEGIGVSNNGDEIMGLSARWRRFGWLRALRLYRRSFVRQQLAS
jgi:hypothetical protein